MASYSKVKLSGSTDGRGVKVAATAIGSGTTIHTAGASGLDEVTLFAMNGDTSDHVLTIGWGGTSSPDDLIVQTIRFKAGLALVVTKLLIGNSLVVKASADSANQVVLLGFVNRIA